ncbi:MAG: MFS transporter [Cytophagaceae bacterium]|nr:MFS transporter [Cytophagaceae bacterium]
MKNIYLVSIILLTFFVISFISNIIGPIIPDLIRTFHLSLTLVSLLPFAFFIAYGVTSIPAGILLETFHEKKVMLMAFSLATLGSLLIVLSPHYLTALISLFLIGSGMAMLQVVINPLLRTAGGEENYANYSVWAQLIFGFASFLSPMVYQYFIGINLPWLSLYILFIGISAIMMLVTVSTPFPKVELANDEKPGAIAIHLELFKNKQVILYFLAMLCYVGTEQGIATWISQFLQTYHGLNPQIDGANTIAYYWGLMTAGGILGIVLLKLLDSRIVLVAFTFLAMIALAFALYGNATMALIAFPLIGFFASVMYPIIFSLALNSVSEHHGSFAGIIVTGIVGGAIFPFIVGGIGDIFGLKTGMSILFLSMGYIFSIGFWAKPLVSNKRIFD